MRKITVIIFACVFMLCSCQTAQVSKDNAQAEADGTAAQVSPVSTPAEKPAPTVKAVKAAPTATAVAEKPKDKKINKQESSAGFKTPSKPVPDSVKQLLTEGDILSAEFKLSEGQKAEALQALGGKTEVRDVYEMYSSKSGVVIMDEQMGKWGLIKTAVLIDPATATFKDYIIYSMSEKRGNGIKMSGFIKQFAGKGLNDDFEIGSGIRAASGATVSSRAMAVTVKRALVVYKLFTEAK